MLIIHFPEMGYPFLLPALVAPQLNEAFIRSVMLIHQPISTDSSKN